MKKHNVELAVLVSNGSKSLEEYLKDSSSFIEGKDGSEYSLKIKNNNPFRVKIVCGLDGLNIINSSLVGDNKDQIGYILNSYQETIIKGYRIDDKTVSAFKFVSKEKAYVNGTNKELNGETIGVIAVKAYQEKVKDYSHLKKLLADLKKNTPEKEYIPVPYYPKFPKPYNPWEWDRPWYDNGYPYGPTYPYNKPFITGASISNTYRCVTSSTANESVGLSDISNELPQNSSFNLGSSWGQKVESVISHVEFETGELLGDLILYYSNRAGLEKMGIEFKKIAQVSTSKLPNPFPGKYCKVPEGWTGEKYVNVHEKYVNVHEK